MVVDDVRIVFETTTCDMSKDSAILKRAVISKSLTLVRVEIVDVIDVRSMYKGFIHTLYNFDD
eukprot:6174410-Pleurochrysis_carterae.AAC.6